MISKDKQRICLLHVVGLSLETMRRHGVWGITVDDGSQSWSLV